MNVYEFDGELFDNASEFLQALAHEYRIGDRDNVITYLDDYGFSLGDLGVRPR